jgi:hypothetical protein
MAGTSFGRPAILSLGNVPATGFVKRNLGCCGSTPERPEKLDQIAPQSVDIVAVGRADETLRKVAGFASQFEQRSFECGLIKANG